MKFLKNTLVFFFALIGFQHLSSQKVSVITYNIRVDQESDGKNKWKIRKTELVDQIKNYKPDFFGLQEATFPQRRFVDSSMINYKQFGVGRDDGKNKGEATPIFYNTKKYTLIKQGTFFLSETPEKVSKGWDAAFNRTCTYGLFQHQKSKEHIWVFNTHFDHRGETAKYESAKLILSRIQDLAPNNALILMGDFNSSPESEVYNILNAKLKDARDVAKKVEGPVGTWNGFDVDIIPDRRIDFVFIRDCRIGLFKQLDDRRENGLWISDHLPVYVKLNF